VARNVTKLRKKGADRAAARKHIFFMAGIFRRSSTGTMIRL
jgi:hypothetical protein